MILFHPPGGYPRYTFRGRNALRSGEVLATQHAQHGSSLDPLPDNHQSIIASRVQAQYDQVPSTVQGPYQSLPSPVRRSLLSRFFPISISLRTSPSLRSRVPLSLSHCSAIVAARLVPVVRPRWFPPWSADIRRSMRASKPIHSLHLHFLAVSQTSRLPRAGRSFPRTNSI